MKAHTPGPWRVDADRCEVQIGEHCRAYQRHDGGIWIDELEANARLIAAAPDMLAALHKALCLIGLRDEWTFAGRHEATEVIRAAIAKAEGREG